MKCNIRHLFFRVFGVSGQSAGFRGSWRRAELVRNAETLALGSEMQKRLGWGEGGWSPSGQVRQVQVLGARLGVLEAPTTNVGGGPTPGPLGGGWGLERLRGWRSGGLEAPKP